MAMILATMDAMKKANHTTDRNSIRDFQQIVNVGPATAKDFLQLGIDEPTELIGQDPWQLFERLCQINHQRYDPCCLDVFISAIDYMNGNPPQKWWSYTPRRKSEYAEQIDELVV